MTCKVGEGQGERAAVRTGGSWEKAGPTGSWGSPWPGCGSICSDSWMPLPRGASRW